MDNWSVPTEYLYHINISFIHIKFRHSTSFWKMIQTYYQIFHAFAHMPLTTILLLINTADQSIFNLEVNQDIIHYIIEGRLGQLTKICHTCVAWICAYGINNYWVIGQYHTCRSIHLCWIQNFTQTSYPCVTWIHRA